MKKKFSVSVNKKIEKFNKTIFVEGDKSISHRYFNKLTLTEPDIIFTAP